LPYEDGTECSETSAYKLQTPGNYPEENIQHYTTTCAGVGKTVAGDARIGLGHPYQLNQSTVSAGV